MAVNFICKQCFKSFSDYKGNERSGFCSLQCYWQARKNNPKYAGFWTGKKRSEETKRKISLNRRGKLLGESHFNWKGGISSEYTKIRNSLEYKEWRKRVFRRDNWSCVRCLYRSKGKRENGYSDIEADHIRPFALFPDLRFEISNGQTLCYRCHKNKTFKKI